MIKREDLIVGTEFLNSLEHKMKVVYSNNIDTAFEYDTGHLTVYRTDYVLSNFDYPEPPKPRTVKVEVADYYSEHNPNILTMKIDCENAQIWKKVIGSERTISIEVNENDC